MELLSSFPYVFGFQQVKVVYHEAIFAMLTNERGKRGKAQGTAWKIKRCKRVLFYLTGQRLELTFDVCGCIYHTCQDLLVFLYVIANELWIRDSLGLGRTLALCLLLKCLFVKMDKEKKRKINKWIVKAISGLEVTACASGLPDLHTKTSPMAK